MKKIVCLILALLLCSASVFADGISVSFDIEDGFTITGQAPAGSKALLLVKTPNNTDDFYVGTDDETKPKNNIYYAAVADYSALGFSFNIPTTQGVSVGSYEIRVSFEDGSKEFVTKALPYWNISNISIADDNKSASVTVSSGTGNEISSPVLLFGVYEAETNRLVSVGFDSATEVTEEVTLTATAEDLPADFETNASKYRTQAFLWDSLERMVPVK